MAAERSDAFVFFRATGDLAFKQIFPALLGLILARGDRWHDPVVTAGPATAPVPAARSIPAAQPTTAEQPVPAPVP